jgi:hypothetical protein
MPTKKRKPRATRHKYRSALEGKAHKLLGAKWKYEPYTIPYVMKRVYKPDFVCDNVLIEVKGYFRSGEQAKYLAVRDSLPKGTELVFVFANPYKKVRKGAKSTMADWCERHGFRYYHINDMRELR